MLNVYKYGRSEERELDPRRWKVSRGGTPEHRGPFEPLRSPRWHFEVKWARLCPYVLCHHAGRNNDLSRPFLLSIGARIARLLNRGYGGHVSNTMFRKLVL